MKGVSFNGIHSYRDLNLVLAPFEIPAPSMKGNYVDVPGADAGVDLTAASGEVKYNYNEFDLTLTAFPFDDWETKKRQITNLLHGLECDIVFDRNPEYRLTGRVSVSERKSNKMLRQFVLHCKTNPYWLKIAESTFSCTLGNSVNLCPRLNEWTTESGATIINDVATVSKSKVVVSPYINYNGGVLSFSAECSAPSVRCYFRSYDSANVMTSKTITLIDGICENFVPPDDCVKYKIRILPKGSTVGEVYIQKFQIESGEVCTDYAPKDGVLIVNENKPVIPTIIVDALTMLTDSKGNNFSINAGTHKILDILIPPGKSIITGTGSGTLTVKFTERTL